MSVTITASTMSTSVVGRDARHQKCRCSRGAERRRRSTWDRRLPREERGNSPPCPAAGAISPERPRMSSTLLRSPAVHPAIDAPSEQCKRAPCGNRASQTGIDFTSDPPTDRLPLSLLKAESRHFGAWRAKWPSDPGLRAGPSIGGRSTSPSTANCDTSVMCRGSSFAGAWTTCEGQRDGMKKPDTLRVASNWVPRARPSVRRCPGRDRRNTPRAPPRQAQWGGGMRADGPVGLPARF